MNNKHTFYPHLKKEIIINQFDVQVDSVELFNKANLRVGLYDSNDRLTGHILYVMETEDYKKWAEDDNFVITFVKRKLREEYEKTISLNVVSTIKNKMEKKSRLIEEQLQQKSNNQS